MAEQKVWRFLRALIQNTTLHSYLFLFRVFASAAAAAVAIRFTLDILRGPRGHNHILYLFCQRRPIKLRDVFI